MKYRSLRLSSEELALLLEMLAIPRLAGQAELSLVALKTDQADLLRASVTRCLVAHDLLLPLADGSFAVYGDLQRLLRLSAAPDAALVVTSKSGDALSPQQESYYRLGDVIVRTYQPYASIYDFALLTEPFDLATTLISWLQPQTRAEVEPVLQIILTQNSLAL